MQKRGRFVQYVARRFLHRVGDLPRGRVTVAAVGEAHHPSTAAIAPLGVADLTRQVR